MGMFSYFLLLLAGAAAILVGPLAFAFWQPEAPVSRLVLRLMAAFGAEAFIAYLAVMGCIVLVLVWSVHVYDYVRFKRNA